MITLPPAVISDTMFLVVIGFISLAGLRRLTRIECVARDKDDTLSRIEDTLFRCQKVLDGIRKAAEKTTEVHVDDTALLGAIAEVGRKVDLLSGLFIVDVTVWFKDDVGYFKSVELPAMPRVDETIALDFASGDGMLAKVDVLGVGHEEEGGCYVYCFAADSSVPYRERLLSGGWTQVESEGVDDVQGSDRGGDHG